MARKRPFPEIDLDNNAAEDESHRTILQSVVQEAVRATAVVLKPMIERVVCEQVERAIAKILPSTKLGSRLPSIQLERSEPMSLRLQFQNKLAFPLYTGCKVEGEHASLIQFSLQNATTGEVVIMDDESSVKLDIVVLEGDFSNDETGDWTYEEFENHVVKEREGKRPLLAGDLSISLKEGMGTLGELIFTDNSSWIRSKKFRLGVRLSTGCLNGMRVREAKTEAFVVKDQRGQPYKKHYPPSLNDDVWRLEKIRKDGVYHKRLRENQVNTVEDLLVLYTTGPLRLRKIFGTTKTWESIIEHAKTCIYQPLGIVRGDGSYMSASSLSDEEQVYMDTLVQEAYKDRSSLCKLPARANYHEAYNDQSSPLEPPSGANYQETDVATRSGHTPQVYDGVSQTEVSKGQQSNGATFSTGYAPNMLQNDTSTSAIVEQFSDGWSPSQFELLEYLLSDGNHCQKEAEHVGTALPLYQSHSDDYNDWIPSGKCSAVSILRTGSFSKHAQNPRAYWIKLKAIFYFMKKTQRRIEQLN